MVESAGARQLPAGVVAVRRTPVFSADTVPPALLANHRTSVWARLEVEAGTVRFLEPASSSDLMVTTDTTVVIAPGVAHRVEPSTDARFAVRFFAEPPLA